VQLLPQVQGSYCTSRIEAQAPIDCGADSSTSIGKYLLNAVKILPMWWICIVFATDCLRKSDSSAIGGFVIGQGLQISEKMPERAQVSGIEG